MRFQPPIHDFSKDDEESISFRVFPLERKSHYDTSVPHRHNYYEIFLFVEGSGVHFIDFETIEIRSNSIHFVSPGQVHMIQRGLGSYGYAILFSRDFYHLNHGGKDTLFSLPFLNNNNRYPVMDLKPAEFQSLTGLVREMETEYTGKSGQREELLCSWLNILLLRSYRYFEHQDIADADTASLRLFRQFRVHLEQDFTRLHKPSEYAALLAISEKYLNGIVKDQSGRTVSEHIQERIGLEARRLLLHSDLSFKEIAAFLNFEDASYFSRFFRKLSGLSPSDFRNESRKKLAFGLSA